MSVYPTEELLKMWSRGELTVEQSIGQMIQHQKTLYERLLQTERRLSTLISEVAIAIRYGTTNNTNNTNDGYAVACLQVIQDCCTANDRGNEITACSSKASKKHD